LIRDFMAQFIDQPCVLVGNSVGSLVVLTVRRSRLHLQTVHCESLRVSNQYWRTVSQRSMALHIVSMCWPDTHVTPAQANAREPEGRVAGTVLVNCAGGVALPPCSTAKLVTRVNLLRSS
jgi:hypothetical protein